MKASSKGHISWRALFIEVLFLCIGVMIALTADNWREERNNQKLAHNALTHIYGEIDYNREFLSDRISYYETLVQEMDSVIALQPAEDRFRFIAHTPAWRGFNPPILRSSTFEAAIASQAMQHMEFNITDQLSRVYSFQDFYLNTIDKFLTDVVSRDSTSIGRVKGIMLEMSQMGRELEGSFEDILEFLSEEGVTAPPEKAP